MDKNTVFAKLLCYGLFPEKLERILQSKSFGDWVGKNINSVNIPKKNRFSILDYRITRNNNSPRYMGIPHPLGFIRLCQEIHKNWDKIETKIDSTTFYKDISMIRVKPNNKNGRLLSMNSYDQDPDREQIQLSKHFGKKFFVHADISTCYPSIYTHSISWALVGKNIAKQNQKKQRVWYNRLDQACQNIQDGETRGLPIGADTSGIMAEIILSQIDKKIKKYSYVRFIDDYKCFCKTKEEADSFIRDLSHSLEEYRLKLNTKKTKILPLPQALNEDWVRKLRQLIDWKEVSNFNKNKIIGFLDSSSELFCENPNESTIRYAIQALKGKKYKNYTAYKLILSYILNLCFLYPYIMDVCVEFIEIGIDTFPKSEFEIKNILKNSLEKILEEHVVYHRSDVITWALFLGIKYDLNFLNFDKTTSKILKTKDCIASLMCFLYRKNQKMGITDFVKIINKVSESEWWLFIYEVKRIESLEQNNSEMEKLRKAEITFLTDELISKLP